MSAWYWRVIALKSVFVLSCFVSYLRAEDTVQKLPFCNPPSTDETPNTDDLVIVSTLDGKLTAFSTQSGTKAWDLETEPLLSSNLHQVELTSGGKWVRLVPSLRGSLYSLSGDTIEPLPFDADQLLSASFKYSDDLVIAGARETQWLGLDVHTGVVIYECGTSGCNGEQTTGSTREVLVLRRHSSIVRALDPRSGSEKWNFSVAEHNLALNRRECINTPRTVGAAVTLAVALPDGEVGVKVPAANDPLWTRKLQAPVAGVWRFRGGVLENMDILREASRELSHSVSPTLYVGLHCNQLYIQESQVYAQKLSALITKSYKPVPWKVVNARPLIGDSANTALSVLENTALALISSDETHKKENHGFFLYLQETCDQAIQVTEETFEDTILPNISEDTSNHIHVHVYSLWFWWKEVLLIAISSALLMNLMIWPRFFVPKVRAATPLPLNQEVIVVERHYERPVQTPEYSGRYENDFTPLRCLGKGGFGVVFEARNNIDHCSYAVKRITLPRKESKRERVLREVRALAKLEHENIVRYFNAWLETPPPAWQEARDKHLIKELEGVSVMSDEYTSPTPAKFQRKDGSVTLNLLKDVDDCVDALEFDKKLSEPKRFRSRSCNDSFSIIFDENASKTPHLTSEPSKISPNSQLTPNSVPIQNGASGDDSFIVFANSNDNGLSEARHNSSFNKHLEKVKQCDLTREVTSGTASSQKKKKGHTRHWSLDLCVRSDSERNSIADTKMYLYIQMQLCLRDNLHDWIRQNRHVDFRYDKVKSLFSQIVSAVEYVHLAGLIHRDLKPSNIFFAPDGKVKVGDFGLVTAMSDSSYDGEPTEEVNANTRHTYKVGTQLYMSPEQLLGRPYSYKVDIFSLGLILFELLQPFSTESERVACLMKVRNGHYPKQFEDNYPNETAVLKQMLCDDPIQRPSASGVKARAPLYEQTDQRWHYTLPTMCAG